MEFVCDTFINDNGNYSIQTNTPLSINNEEIICCVPRMRNYYASTSTITSLDVSANTFEHIGYSYPINSLTTGSIGSTFANSRLLQTLSLTQGTYIIQGQLALRMINGTTSILGPCDILFYISDISSGRPVDYKRFAGGISQHNNYMYNNTILNNGVFITRLVIQIKLNVSIYFRVEFNSPIVGLYTRGTLCWSQTRIA